MHITAPPLHRLHHTPRSLTCPPPLLPPCHPQMAQHSLAGDFRELDVVPAVRLLEVVLQNCRGQVDACVGPYLALATAKLASAETNRMKDALLVLVADALYYNAPLALGALQQSGALQAVLGAVFSAIFERKPGGGPKHFKRSNDKKVWAATTAVAVRCCSSGCGRLHVALMLCCCMYTAHGCSCCSAAGLLSAMIPERLADTCCPRCPLLQVVLLGLCSVLALPSLPAELEAGLPQLMSGVLKLLLDLKQQQEEAEQAANRSSEEEEEEEEEGEGEQACCWLLAAALRSSVTCALAPMTPKDCCCPGMAGMHEAGQVPVTQAAMPQVAPPHPSRLNDLLYTLPVTPCPPPPPPAH
jgi:hypothetical protein